MNTLVSAKGISQVSQGVFPSLLFKTGAEWGWAPALHTWARCPTAGICETEPHNSADTTNIPRHCKSLPQQGQKQPKKCKPSPKPNPKYCEQNRGGEKSHIPLLKEFLDSPSARTKEIKTQNNSNTGLLFTFNISFLFAPPKVFSYIKIQLKY